MSPETISRAWKDSSFKRKLLKHHLWRSFFSSIRSRYLLADVEQFRMMLDLKDRMGCSKIILKYGGFERFASRLAIEALGGNKSVIDVGANIGYWSLLTSFATKGQIFAFEPEPYNYELLRTNIDLNKRTNITTFMKAAADQPGHLKLYKSGDNSGDHRLYDSGEDREAVVVDVVRIDDTVGVVPNLGLIKIDVQGYELPVVKGLNNNLMENSGVKVISEFWPQGMKRAGFNPNDYLDFFEHRGFSWKLVSPETETLETLDRQQLFANCAGDDYVDLLFCRS